MPRTGNKLSQIPRRPKPRQSPPENRGRRGRLSTPDQRHPDSDADNVQGLVEPDRNQAGFRRLTAFLEDPHPPGHRHAGINQQVDESQHQPGLPAQGEAKAQGVDGGVSPGGGMPQARSCSAPSSRSAKSSPPPGAPPGLFRNGVIAGSEPDELPGVPRPRLLLLTVSGIENGLCRPGGRLLEPG